MKYSKVFLHVQSQSNRRQFLVIYLRINLLPRTYLKPNQQFYMYINILH